MDGELWLTLQLLNTGGLVCTPVCHVWDRAPRHACPKVNLSQCPLKNVICQDCPDHTKCYREVHLKTQLGGKENKQTKHHKQKKTLAAGTAFAFHTLYVGYITNVVKAGWTEQPTFHMGYFGKTLPSVLDNMNPIWGTWNFPILSFMTVK